MVSIRVIFVLNVLMILNIDCMARFLYLEAEVSSANPISNCENGEIDLTINGEFPPYEVIWSFQDLDFAKPPSNIKALTDCFPRRNIEDLKNLSPGYYTVVVNDWACGSLSATFTINCECLECDLIASVDSLQTSKRKEFLSIAKLNKKVPNIEYYKFLYKNSKRLESNRARSSILKTIIGMPIRDIDDPYHFVSSLYVDAMNDLIELNKNNLNELYTIKIHEDFKRKIFPILKAVIEENEEGYWGRERIPDNKWSYSGHALPFITFRSEAEIANEMKAVPINLNKELPGKYYSENSKLLGFHVELILKKNGEGVYDFKDHNKFKFLWELRGDSIYLSNVREIFKNKLEQINARKSFLYKNLTSFRLKVDPLKSRIMLEFAEENMSVIYTRKKDVFLRRQIKSRINIVIRYLGVPGIY